MTETTIAQLLAAKGVRIIRELAGGHQSRVYLADQSGAEIIVKVVDADLVELDAYRRRVEMVGRLERLMPEVVGPLPIEGSLTTVVDGSIVSAYPFVQGDVPSVDDERHVELMGRTLQSLHAALATLSLTVATAPDLDGWQPVAALRVALPAPLPSIDSPVQLLHGDYSPGNLRLVHGRFGPPQVRILDFDDAGVGPIEFELANTVFMMWFDQPELLERVQRFRRALLMGYATSGARRVDEAIVDGFVEHRRQALLTWATHPADAPIGIRTATSEWHQRLLEIATAMDVSKLAT